jgi:hypothetical protein
MKIVCGGIDFSINGKTVPLMGKAREEMLRRFYNKEDLSPFQSTTLNHGVITWEDVDWDTVDLKRLGVV